MYSFLDELYMPQECLATLYGDNMGATALLQDTNGHVHVKHINIHEHYIHKHVTAGDVELQHVPSAENLADIFMKVLPHDTHLVIVHTLGLMELGSGAEMLNMRGSFCPPSSTITFIHYFFILY